jgi:predicted deacylase
VNTTNEKRADTQVRPYGAVALLLVVAMMCIVASREFLSQHVDEPLYPSAALTKTGHLSDYFPELKGTRADTDVYFFEGKEPGGTCLILGGTHPNEPAGFITAYALLENISIKRGTLIIIPRTNHSAFTCTEPTEGHPTHFTIGDRSFRYGCRFTNPLDQWPDPEVYLHFPSGQELSGGETRNMNRAYPGRRDGNFTERVAFAITSLVKTEKVDLVIDLHEASPEYPVINAIVAHERAMDVAAMANLMLQAKGLNYSLEPSPKNFHGLTHRELGDATDAMVALMETANISQGRLRGTTTAEKILSGKDKEYLRAAKARKLRVPYDSTGISLDVRVGRHLEGISALLEALEMLKPERAIHVSGIPDYATVQDKGVAAFLAKNNQ